MSLVSTAKLKNIYPIREKLIIYGYLREVQQLFDEIDNPYYNIPLAINDICLEYYHSNIKWDPEKCGSELIVSGLQQNTVSTPINSLSKDWTVYHTNWYHSEWNGFVRFSVKVEKLKSNLTLFIGFASFDDIIDFKFYSEMERINYALQFSQNYLIT